MSLQRLDKILASQGTKTRSEVKALIKSGAVKVNGEICKKCDFKADADSDKIEVNGVTLEFKQYVYLMMNKPAGVLSASNDKKAQTVVDLVPEELRRKNLFPAGRLDKDTEGLIILTDDGDFAHRMLSPKKKVYKRYEAVLDGAFTGEMQKLFKEGIILTDGVKCLPAYAKKISNSPPTAEVWICEGKFHQVKKMFQSVGLNVIYLKRTDIGCLQLDVNLHKGQCRVLNDYELKSIFISKMP